MPKRRSCHLAGVMVIASLAVAASASAHIAHSPRQPRTDHYWTAKRMREATPVPITAANTASAGAPRPSTDRRTSPVYGPPGQPGSLSAPKSTTVTCYSCFPYDTNGKVFFEELDGGVWKNHSCSATIVESENHCVYGHDPTISGAQTWARHWIFIPGYWRNIVTKFQYRPYGTWTAKKLFATAQWVKGRNNDRNWSNYDEGAVILYPNVNGTVAGAVGSRGITFYQPYKQYYHSFGYPGYNGCCLKEADSWFQGYDPDTEGDGPTTQWINSDLTAGSSGGGWVIGAGAGWVDGLNSYAKRSTPGRVYGPYFGNAARSLYQYVRRR